MQTDRQKNLDRPTSRLTNGWETVIETNKEQMVGQTKAEPNTKVLQLVSRHYTMKANDHLYTATNSIKRSILLVSDFHTYIFNGNNFGFTTALKLWAPQHYGQFFGTVCSYHLNITTANYFSGRDPAKIGKASARDNKSVRPSVGIQTQFQVPVTMHDPQVSEKKRISPSHQMCLNCSIKVRKARLEVLCQSLWWSDWIKFDIWLRGRKDGEKEGEEETFENQP